MAAERTAPGPDLDHYRREIRRMVEDRRRRDTSVPAYEAVPIEVHELERPLVDGVARGVEPSARWQQLSVDSIALAIAWRDFGEAWERGEEDLDTLASFERSVTDTQRRVVRLIDGMITTTPQKLRVLELARARLAALAVAVLELRSAAPVREPTDELPVMSSDALDATLLEDDLGAGAPLVIGLPVDGDVRSIEHFLGDARSDLEELRRELGELAALVALCPIGHGSWTLCVAERDALEGRVAPVAPRLSVLLELTSVVSFAVSQSFGWVFFGGAERRYPAAEAPDVRAARLDALEAIVLAHEEQRRLARIREDHSLDRVLAPISRRLDDLVSAGRWVQKQMEEEPSGVFRFSLPETLSGP